VARVSRFYTHCERVYVALLANASEDASGDALYKGHATKLMADLGLPTSYYARILMSLEKMGCITRVQRGARHVESVIALHGQPTLEAYEAVISTDNTIKQREEKAIERQRYSDLDSRITNLEAVVFGEKA